ncbi:MAG TPA: CsbD family protein [Terriglobales bacterium]|jgi:uncharacterized protein YjbJ (UPF0337 family)|nr:CsbD family protein [Terriglobales bacterium]
MNEDILSGQWRQIKGSLRSWWGDLTDDDIESIGGQKDKLVGWVQDRYGRSREQAAGEVDARLREFAETHGSTIADMKAKAYEVSETVANKASGAATAMRSGVEKASSYFQENSFDSIGSDIADIVRKYPLQSVLIGIGLGIWLARSIKR